MQYILVRAVSVKIIRAYKYMNIHIFTSLLYIVLLKNAGTSLVQYLGRQALDAYSSHPLCVCVCVCVCLYDFHACFSATAKR